MAVAGIEQQLLGARLVLYQRRPQFNEFLRHRNTVVDRRHGAAKSGQQSALLGGVRLQ
jgi:hypothetical protein